MKNIALDFSSDREEKPAYLKIFGKADEPELENAWMNNVKHLEFISDTNYNKEVTMKS